LTTVQVLYVIAHPEVFKSPDSNCYIVFGEVSPPGPAPHTPLTARAHQAKVEDQSGLMQAPYNFQPSAQQAQMSKSAEKKKATAGKAAANDDEPADETGLEAKDIAIIMAQTNCSRSAAVRALRDADGDMINAISACPQLACP
jgi:nascent polypeptide-associated complex subunit alpha